MQPFSLSPNLSLEFLSGFILHSAMAAITFLQRGLPGRKIVCLDLTDTITHCNKKKCLAKQQKFYFLLDVFFLHQNTVSLSTETKKEGNQRCNFEFTTIVLFQPRDMLYLLVSLVSQFPCKMETAVLPLMVFW